MADEKSDIKRELREAVANRLPDTIISQGLVEHEIDTIGILVQYILSTMDTTNAPQHIKDAMVALDGYMEASSIDYMNLSDVKQSYKNPKAIGFKHYVRKQQDRYLQRQMEEGIL